MTMVNVPCHGWEWPVIQTMLKPAAGSQAELLGLQGEINVQGEDQKKLDAWEPRVSPKNLLSWCCTHWSIFLTYLDPPSLPIKNYWSRLGFLHLQLCYTFWLSLGLGHSLSFIEKRLQEKAHEDQVKPIVFPCFFLVIFHESCHLRKVITNDVFKNALRYTGKLGTLASEEEDEPVDGSRRFGRIVVILASSQ